MRGRHAFEHSCASLYIYTYSEMLVRLDKIIPTHADLFMERYNRLLASAMRLTGYDRQQAEDLLHDAYIQFTISRPELSHIRDLDAYLYITIRNLHLSEVRRATRSPLEPLPVLEFDSAELRLSGLSGSSSSDPFRRMSVQDELRRICGYACVRKETAKAASVLILRFFHGYYPEEISRLLKISLPAVKERLRLARSEARLYLDDPDRLSFMHGPSVQISETRIGQSTADFLADLRRTIFSSRQGACISPRRLTEMSLSPNSEGPECHELAHIVSCESCLDKANSLLGLPFLRERFATDAVGKHTRKTDGPDGKHGPDGGGPAGGVGQSGSGGSSRRHQRGARDVFEHEPKELFVSANGYVVGSQKISSELMEQTHSIHIPEPIGFIEVFSEQNVRMLLLNVESLPEGETVQSARAELSGGRELQINLNFAGSWPSVQVTYSDPQLKFVENAAPDAHRQSAGLHANSIAGNSGRRNAPLFNALIGSLLRGEGPSWFRWFKPVFITLVLAAALIAGLVLTRKHPGSQSVSIADLLTRSEAAEQAALSGQVLHRTLELEETRVSSGETVSRHRIELWQNGDKHLRARRVYDETGHLVAGQWNKADGSVTIYARGASPEIQSQGRTYEHLSMDFRDVWQLDPSAKEFAVLGGESAGAKLETAPSNYTLALNAPADGDHPGPALVSAALVLNKADLHATEETLVVRQNGEERKFRFVETRYERRPVKAVPPAIFDMDPELAPRVSAAASGAGPAKPAAEESVAPASMVASPETEVRVLELLNRIGADLGQEVIVTRTAAGLLNLQAAVDTERRKREILAALEPVAHDPTVRLRIETVAEAQERALKDRAASLKPGDQSPVTIGSEAVRADQSIPAADYIRRYLLARGTPNAKIDQESARLATEILSRSEQAMLHVWAMKDLAGRFSEDDLRTMSPDTKSRWMAMVASHARAYRQESDSLRRLLADIFNLPFLDSVGESAGGIAGTNGDAVLIESVAALLDLASRAHKTLRPEFSVSSKKNAGTGIQAGALLESLERSEQSASIVQRLAIQDKP